ncbi:hypothetical protein P9597_11010 [Aneurinibacillus migulanus]|uniref:hypothetical protein n=1 Tax=Aneurinibacillus migulanus TaxID=47500 RepID=UPI002E1E44F3|nr:hypothetical protein [Aneurinibacillus migulanus]
MKVVLILVVIFFAVTVLLNYIQGRLYKRHCSKLKSLFTEEFGSCVKYEHKSDGAYHVYTGTELWEVRVKRPGYFIKEKKALLRIQA